MDLPEVLTNHAVVHLAISNSDCRTIPLLLDLTQPTEFQICLSTVAYARYLQIQGNLGYSSIYKEVSIIGKLRDYYQLVKRSEAVTPQGMRRLLDEFLYAFDTGSVLGWEPAGSGEYAQARLGVYDYAKWLIDNSDIQWPASELQLIEAMRDSWTSISHQDKSLLFHTKKRAKTKRTRGRKRSTTGLRQSRPFPPHLVVQLIESTRNIRDKLIFGVLAFGGRRVSELANTFLSDVAQDKDGLTVLLGHPSNSNIVWVNRLGAERKTTRKVFLKDGFDLMPRTDHGAETTAAGWKGIKYDDTVAKESDMYFILGAERYLLNLHEKYLYEYRAVLPKKPHPYYLVALDGTPLKLKAIERQFRLACRRLERKHGISLEGYGLHSLRHYYGFYCTEVLKIDLLWLQKYMGHTQPSSTAVYSHISKDRAHQELRRAEKKHELTDGQAMFAEQRDAVHAQFMAVAAEELPSHWLHALEPAGKFVPTGLTRKFG